MEGIFVKNGLLGNYDLPQSEVADNPTLQEAGRENIVRMWWNHQNLNAARRDKAGVRWNFMVWHDVVDGVHKERIFFWNEDRDSTGVVEFSPGIHVKQLHAVIDKLVADPQLRELHSRELLFPIERHYSNYEPFQQNIE